MVDGKEESRPIFRVLSRTEASKENYRLPFREEIEKNRAETSKTRPRKKGRAVLVLFTLAMAVEIFQGPKISSGGSKT